MGITFNLFNKRFTMRQTLCSLAQLCAVMCSSYVGHAKNNEKTPHKKGGARFALHPILLRGSLAMKII
jgi:hypothetical protein